LAGYDAAPVRDEDLAVEDRWILSRLTTVTTQVTESLNAYHFADAARVLYDFAWDEYCSFYLEILKSRLQDESGRRVAQRVLAHVLDGLLRLLHPMIPFITEEVWQRLNQIAPRRDWDGKGGAAPASIMVAPWPEANLRWQDTTIEARFATFQAVLGAVREIRTRQNIDRRTRIRFLVRAVADVCELLRPMQPYFESMANAESAEWGPQVTPPTTHAAVTVRGIDVIVDLSGLIDVAAELQRNEQLEKKLFGQIEGKRKKLDNESFVARAPVDIVAKERESLRQLEEQLGLVRAALVELRKQAGTTN
ncbi:MAG: class I tRNA ligase family protein, partial [Pirellulaceae bacterium]